MATTRKTEHPMLFQDWGVRAMLAGVKTQTRRVVGIQPLDVLPMRIPDMWCSLDRRDEDGQGHGSVWRCRYGVPGEHIWVRETVAYENWTREFGDTPPIPKDRPSFHSPSINEYDEEYWLFPHYRATDPAPELAYDDHDEPTVLWRPSIHMHRWACRLTLEIVLVRCRRLQAITQEECIQEGANFWADEHNWDHRTAKPKYWFAKLWNEIHVDDGFSWDANPWVWAITFKAIPWRPS